MVVSVFAGCGKTWLANHQNKYGYSMRDSDSSTYEKTAGWEKEYGNKSGTLYCWNVSDVQSMDMSLRELGVKRAPQSWMYLLVPDDKTF